jgi:hypothetical protein
MIANGEYLYYVYNDDLYQYPINQTDAVPKKLTVISDSNYDLGNLNNPVSISFKGDNLLIADDTLHAIQ